MQIPYRHNSEFLPEGPGLITDPETGYTIPGIAGGAPEETVEGMLEAQQGQQPQEPVEQELEEEEEEDDEPNFNGETFLASIEDEELRARVEPVIKKWDAGVTRRFQELHSQLKPYQELGDYERLTEAQKLYDILNERPEDLYRSLAEALGYGQQEIGQQGQPGQQSQTPSGQQGANGYPQGMTPQQQQQYAQLSPEIQQQIEQQGKIAETLAEAYLNDQKARQQQEEDAALDTYLSNLKTELGDFDEDYVLAKMLNGMDGVKAVKAYHKAVKKQLAGQRAANAPTVLSGGGQIAQENLNVAELDNKGVKELVAGLIAQSSGE